MRSLLYGGAALMAGWIVLATLLWLQQNAGDPVAGFSYFWGMVTADWLLVLLVTDLMVFTVAAFVWVTLDLRRRRASWRQVVAWLAPMLVLGSAVLLVYIARRPRATAA
jgi:hypothetical protein